MHQTSICLWIPLVKYNFCSILFNKSEQSWEIWQNEVQDEKK